MQKRADEKSKTWVEQFLTLGDKLGFHVTEIPAEILMSADAKFRARLTGCNSTSISACADALALVPYLHELGVSHIYASPLFKAVPHSAHGYDVCDFNQLNPEIGTEADLEKLVNALHAKQNGADSRHCSQSHGNRFAGKSVVVGRSEKWPRKPVRGLFRH